MRKNNRLIVFLAAITALFLISGCTGGPKETDFLAYVGGTEGLNTYLIEGMPPPQIHDSNTFPFGVGVAIENRGEADVKPVNGISYEQIIVPSPVSGSSLIKLFGVQSSLCKSPDTLISPI